MRHPDPEPTYLRLHDVVHVFGRLHRVSKLNDCQARIVPLKRQTKTFTPATGNHAGQPVKFTVVEDGHSISPNSPLDILGTYDPATGNVKWHKESDAGRVASDEKPEAVAPPATRHPSPVTTLSQSELL
jgi:hypothetical protein